MGILTVVIDSRGACVPYLEIMEQLWQEGVESLTYVPDDLRSYVNTLNVPTVVDRFNFAQFSAGGALYESADNGLALLLAGRQITAAWIPSAMQTIAAAAEAGQFDPAQTIVVGNGGALLMLGHFLLELGIRQFVSLESYRLIDWHNLWQQDRSHMTPDILPKPLGTQMLRLLIGAQGKQKAREFFGRPVPYDFSSIKTAIQRQLYMYSPQLVDDQHLAYGYPYPMTTGELPDDLAKFIDDHKRHGRRIIVFTTGSMDVSRTRKADLIQQFMAGVRGLGDAAGVILDDVVVDNGNFFATPHFVPYTALFPQADMVVVHGGSGTTHLALFTGTPVLNIPFVKDQYDWANRLKKLGMQVDMIPQQQFTAERFVSAMNQNYSDAVVAAARQAGEAERTRYNNPRVLMDELINVAETVRPVRSAVTR